MGVPVSDATYAAKRSDENTTHVVGQQHHGRLLSMAKARFKHLASTPKAPPIKVTRAIIFRSADRSRMVQNLVGKHNGRK